MAIDGYLELIKDGEPIKGGSNDVIFKGLIDVLSFSMSARRDLTTESRTEDALEFAEAGGGEEMASSQEMPVDSFSLEITKEVDLSSPDLFNNYCQTSTKLQDPFDSATFYFRVAGGSSMFKAGSDKEAVCFLVMEVTKPYVYSYHLESKSTSIPQENVKFFFQTYELKYKPQKGAGDLSQPIVKSHDLGYDPSSQ